DLKETAAASGGDIPVATLPAILTALWESPKPVLARVAGPARAGGLGLIGAADLAIAAEDATFAFTEVRLGVIPAVISATLLRRPAAGTLADELAELSSLSVRYFTGPEGREGVRAFAEKRDPAWVPKG